jgi:hypothetical protein
MDKAVLQEELFHLTAYLITSARGLYEEPADYGVFRLLDAAGRLLEIMEDNGLLDDPFLGELKQMVDEERAGSMDDERQRQSLDEMVQRIAAEMRRRL